MKAKKVIFYNQKGGVGKTTSAVNLGSALADMNFKVLLIDFDAQCNLTGAVSGNPKKANIYQVVTGEVPASNAVQSTIFKNLFLIPGSVDVSGLSIELVNENNREYYLKTVLEGIEDDYDFILLDCPPSLGLLTTNALTAANSVIIPVQCEFFALEGIMQLLNSIMLAQKTLNPTLDIEGVLLTMLDNRTNLGLEVVQDIKSYFKERVYDTIIPRLVRLSEAPSHGKPIIYYDPKSRGAEAYINLAKEVISRNGK